MDKVILKFLADVLYIKGFIFFEEFEAIYDARNPNDLNDIVDKMLRGDFNGYRRGEATYIGSGQIRAEVTD